METIYELPAEKGYTIYTKSQCSFCVKSKTLLKAEAFTMIDCDEYIIDDKDSFLQFIEGLIGKSYRTFPMIFHDGKFLGGYAETKEHYEKACAFADAFANEFADM